MAYIGILPVAISFQSTIGPSFSTDITVTDGGWEQRNQNWEAARLRGEAMYAARIAKKEAELLSFFRQARGRLHTFGVKDWTDFRAEDNAGHGILVQIGTASSGDTYQLYKEYGDATYAEARKITRPKEYIDITGITSPDIDYTTGIVTVASGTPTSWTGEFYVPCRFDTDEMAREMIDRAGDDLIIGWSQVPIVEVRE